MSSNTTTIKTKDKIAQNWLVERGVFVSNLPLFFDRQVLKSLFEKGVGNVAFVELYTDDQFSMVKYGYIQFKEMKYVQEAVDAMNNFVLANGKKMKVVIASTTTKDSFIKEELRSQEIFRKIESTKAKLEEVIAKKKIDAAIIDHIKSSNLVINCNNIKTEKFVLDSPKHLNDFEKLRDVNKNQTESPDLDLFNSYRKNDMEEIEQEDSKEHLEELKKILQQSQNSYDNRINFNEIETNIIQVKNIPENVKWKKVKELFSKAGKIQFCKVDNNKAIIEYVNAPNAALAIEMYNNHRFEGNRLKVKFL